MERQDTLDQQALVAATRHMGGVAWPTVVLGLIVAVVYLATPLLVVTNSASLLVAVPVMAFCTYAAYTVLHEAVHGSISGGDRRLRWLNEALGYVSGWIVIIPMTAHRHEHLAHHRHTNQPDEDPDFVVADMTRSPMHAIKAANRIYFGQFSHFFRNRWSKGPRAQNVYLCLEMFAAFAPRLAFLAAGFWYEGLLLFVLGWMFGVTVLVFLFAYIVHTPHRAVGRYVDTSTIVVGGVTGRLLTLLWGYQNYHSIHHLFPRVPFYKYRSLFDEIEPIMTAKEAPIHHVGIQKLLSGKGLPA